MDAFKQEELFPNGIAPKTYGEILGALRKDLISIHEYSCASGDLLNSLGRHTGGEIGQVITKSGEVNFAMIEALEGMLSSLAAVEKSEEAILVATLLAYQKPSNQKPRRRKTALWFAIGAVSTLAVVGISWVGVARTGSVIGYSRAIDDLAVGGMIEIKRHGDWVDLTMGPSNPVGRDDPAKPRPRLRLEADKVPELR